MSEPKPLTGRIRALMADGKPRTVAQAAQALGGKPDSVRDVLARMVAAEQVHVSGYVGAHNAKVFRFGPGENATPPLLDTKKARQTRARRRAAAADPWHEPKQRFTDDEMDRRHRAPDTWWPEADPVVTEAMRALAREASDET